MSHFLRASEIAPRTLTKLYAAVLVRVTGRREVTVDADRGVFVLDPSKGVTLTELPADVRVLDSDGDPIEPSRRFWITTCTFDPCHAVTDMDAPW